MTTMPTIRLAVLISAGGTTLQNLIDRIAGAPEESSSRCPARIVQVVSSNAGVFGVERARRAGLPTAIVTRKEAGSR